MGSGSSSKEKPKPEVKAQPSQPPSNSLSVQNTRRTMGPKRSPVRTKSIIEGEQYDTLLIRHPTLKPVLREYDKVIDKLKKMNGKISEDSYGDVYKLLDEKIDDPFQEIGGLEERLLMGNYLAKHNFLPHLVDIYEAIWTNHSLEYFDDDLEDDEEDTEFFKLLKLIRTILWNYADGSDKFAEAIISDTHFFQFLTEDLLAVKDDLRELDDEITNENHFPFNSTLGILNNCARNAATKDVYKIQRLNNKDGGKEGDMVEILEDLLKTDITYVKLVVLLALSYMVNEEQNKQITADETIFDFLLNMVKQAEKAKDRRQWGFSIHELLNGLAKLAKNDKNKTIIMDKGAFEILKRILKQGSEAEQLATVNVIWELSFAQKNKTLFKDDKEMMASLKNLRKSDNQELSKAAQGAYFVIDEGKDRQKAKKEKPKGGLVETGHIMLSYNWDDQKTILMIRNLLVEQGLNVWMDVDKMEGSILEAMARAVEDARVVLVCYSEKYKDSQNCRTEAEYAYSQKKEIVPLRMQQGYAATGWLGAMIGAKLFYDFSGKYDFDKKFQELYLALSGQTSAGTPQKTLSTISETAVVSKPLPQINEEDSAVLLSWTKSDIDNWLKVNNLAAFSGLKNLSGPQLVFLYKLFTRAPDYFYKCIEEKLGMKSLEDLMRFSDAIEKLQLEHPA